MISPMSRFRLVSGVIASTLLLSGCAEKPLESVDVAVPARFDAAELRPATTLTRWWSRYGSAGMTKLVDQADNSNFDIAAAVAQVEAAEAQARIAGASLLPALTGAGNGARNQSSGTNSSGGSIGRQSLRTSLSGVISAGYEIDLWGKNRALLTAAEASTQSQIYAEQVVRLSTRAAVVNAYLQLTASRERLAIAQENLRNAERIRGIIRTRMETGTSNALDLAQQESLVALQRAALPTLRQNIEISRTALALLLGRVPEGFKVQPVSLWVLKVPSVAPGLPSSLLYRRPDLNQAEAHLAAADANVEAARKAMLPAIQLTGQTGVQSASLTHLLRPESVIWSLASGLTQPIFDGGRLRAQADLTEADRRVLLENYRKAIVSALVDVENALVAVRESALRESAQQVAVTKSREAFRLSEERLRQGAIDLQTLLSTQSTLYQTQDGLVQDRLLRLQASLSLFQALGGDFADPVPVIRR